MSKRHSDLVNRIFKKYIDDKFPEYYELSDNILEFYHESDKTIVLDKKRFSDRSISFLSNNELILFNEIVLPFISGVVSSIIASILYDKLINEKEAQNEINKISQREMNKMGNNKNHVIDISPYILDEMMSELNAIKLSNNADIT